MVNFEYIYICIYYFYKMKIIGLEISIFKLLL